MKGINSGGRLTRYSSNRSKGISYEKYFIHIQPVLFGIICAAPSKPSGNVSQPQPSNSTSHPVTALDKNGNGIEDLFESTRSGSGGTESDPNLNIQAN